VCSRTDARTITTTYAYDALNRLTSKTYSGTTPAAYFSYDETAYGGKTLSNTKGRVSHTSAAGGTAITIHSYDAAGRVKDYWQCTPYNCPGGTYWGISYSYDLAGDVASWMPPAGYTVTNQISTAQRITQVSSSLNDSTHPGTLAALTYTPWGAVKTLQNGCAGASCVQRRETYEFNNRLQPYWVELGTADTPAAQFCLVYNYYPGVATPTTCAVPSQASSGNNGNIVGYFYRDSTNAALQHKTDFTYDSLNRLASSIATPVSPGTVSHNLDFAYDRYGNATCVTDGQTNGPCPNWTFNATTNRMSTSGFNYDAAGNTLADGSCSYTWDGEGRVTSVGGTGCNAATYTYNALGQRVEKHVGSAYTEIVYDLGGQPIGYHNRTAWTKQYVPLGGGMVALYQDNATFFIHPNHLGSTTTVFNHTGGSVAQDEIFYPWGERWNYAGTLYDERFAAMQLRDAESGLDPTLFRMYESRLYRWLTPDPLAGSIFNPQSLNRYAYVLNNPTNFIDPLGLDCNVFNGSWEGSGSPFPCWQQASWHYPSPAESPTSIAGPVGVATGSMIGTESPEFAEGEFNYVRNLELAGTGYRVLPDGRMQGWVPASRDASGEPVPGHWEDVQPCFGGDALCDSAGNVVRVNGNIESDNVANAAMAGAAYAAWDIGMVQAGRLFGTRLGGNMPVFNANQYLRIGWSWSAKYGQYAFRIGGSVVAWLQENPHIYLWPPSWWGGPPGH
jgi:RHS repeat-associated protein